TASLAGAATGTRFEMEPGAGYMSRERLFLIEKSCAGVNFMIAAFAMSAYVLRRRVVTLWSAAGTYAACLSAGYAAAVLVNAPRIAAAVWLAAVSPPSRIAPAQLHRIEGVVVYFGGLMLLHEIVVRIDATLKGPATLVTPTGTLVTLAPSRRCPQANG